MMIYQKVGIKVEKLSFNGRLAEWLIAAVLKTVVYCEVHPEFESRIFLHLLIYGIKFMSTTQNVKVNNSGIGLFGALTVLFVALKLTGYIHWSWWLVTVLIWAPLLVILTIFIIATIISIINFK